MESLVCGPLALLEAKFCIGDAGLPHLTFTCCCNGASFRGCFRLLWVPRDVHGDKGCPCVPGSVLCEPPLACQGVTWGNGGDGCPEIPVQCLWCWAKAVCSSSPPLDPPSGPTCCQKSQRGCCSACPSSRAVSSFRARPGLWLIAWSRVPASSIPSAAGTWASAAPPLELLSQASSAHGSFLRRTTAAFLASVRVRQAASSRPGSRMHFKARILSPSRLSP